MYEFPAGAVAAYRLDGDHTTGSNVGEDLHGWPILQRRGIDESMQAKVRAAIGDWKNYERTMEGGYACFDPRLAFRVGEKEEAVDVLICLECRWVYFYRVRDAKQAREPLCISEAGLGAFGKVDEMVFGRSLATTRAMPSR